MVRDQYELAKFIKQKIYGSKVVIGMGAGSISNWLKELPKII
jgi:UDP-N-acetylmuramate--alanine ligase